MPPAHRGVPNHGRGPGLDRLPVGQGLWERLAPEQAGATLDALSSHVALLDSDGTVLAVNLAWARFGAQNGAERDGAYVGTNYLAVCDRASGSVSDEATRTAEGLRRLLSGAIEEFRQQYRCETTSGVRWYQMRASRYTREGRVHAVVAHEDITEVMRAYDALAESESRFLQITGVIDQVFWMNAHNPHRVVYVSPAFERLWGIPCDELYRDPLLWTSIIHEDDRQRVIETHGEWFRSGGIGPWEEEYRIIRRDGSFRWIRDRARAVPGAADGSHTGFLCGLAEDVTELRTYRDHLEHLVEDRTRQLRESNELLAQQDRLASIGTLAAGIGHDLANILFPMRCRLDVLEAGDLPDSLRSEVKGLRSTIEYLQRLSTSLRLCALDPLEPRAADGVTALAEWCADARPIIDKSVPERIDLQWRIPGELPPVALAPHQLTQAVLNLVGNAAEAISERGAIVVSAAPSRRDPSVIDLVVRDTGCGMSDDTRRHALHPFFTTKRRGRSTGLGLSLVHSIIKSAGGDLLIESAPDKGTTVTLRLPVVEARPAEAAAAPPAHGVVALSLADPRRSALARHVASALGFSVREPANNAPGDADIWMTEAHPGARAAAAAYLSRAPGRAVVVFAPGEDDWADLGAVAIDDATGLDGVMTALLAAQQNRSAPK